MNICEFCLAKTPDDLCRFGLKMPKTMRCREFAPGIDRFCAEPADFVSPNQIVEMAMFFGLQKTELKKVKVLAEKRGSEVSVELAKVVLTGP
jgi:hypothetical protein